MLNGRPRRLIAELSTDEALDLKIMASKGVARETIGEKFGLSVIQVGRAIVSQRWNKELVSRASATGRLMELLGPEPYMFNDTR